MNIVLIALPILFLAVSVLLAVRSVKKGKTTMRALGTQLAAFAAVSVILFAAPLVAHAAAGDPPAPTPDTTAAAQGSDSSKGWGLVAAALAVGIAGIGGGVAVAAAAPAAIGATSEDPKAFGKAMIFVALGESIALYGFVISFMILGKV